MLKVTDIRVGNLILRKGKPFWVDIWTFVQIHQAYAERWDFLNECSGIPIDAAWLRRAGFVSDIYFEGDRPIYGNGKMYINWDKLQPMDAGFPIAEQKIEFIHQLQNLYFALYGDDLKISTLLLPL